MLSWTEIVVVFFQAEDGIRELVRSRGLGDVYKRQAWARARWTVCTCGRERAAPTDQCSAQRWPGVGARRGEGLSVPRPRVGGTAQHIRARATQGRCREHRRERPVARGGLMEITRALATGRRLLREHGLDDWTCLLYTSPSPRDRTRYRMPSSA